MCEMKTKLSRTSWFQGELLLTSIESGNCLRCPTSCRRHDLCRGLHTLHVADTIFAAEPTITQTLICDWSLPRACHTSNRDRLQILHGHTLLYTNVITPSCMFAECFHLLVYSVPKHVQKRLTCSPRATVHLQHVQLLQIG